MEVSTLPLPVSKAKSRDAAEPNGQLSRSSSGSRSVTSSTHCPFCPEPTFLLHECKLYRKFEEALEAVGCFGRYQIYMCLLLLYSTVMWEGNFSVDFFNQIRPTWVCNDTGLSNPMEVNRLDHKEMCRIWDLCENMTVVSRYFFSTVEEWKLECDRHSAMFYIGTFRLLAMLIGAFVAGHIGDLLGRKRYLYMWLPCPYTYTVDGYVNRSQYCFCITGVMSIAARSWQAYAAMTALSGFFYAIVEITGLTLALEYTDSKHRLLVNCCFQSAFAYIILAPMGYLTGSWRMYLTMVNFLCSPLLLGYLVLHESPRWVIQSGDLQRASTILTEIGSDRWNHTGIDVNPEQLRLIPRTRGPKKFYHLGHLFASKQLALQTSLLFLAGIAEVFSQHASHIDKHRLVVNPFAQFALNGAMNLWIPFLLIFVDWRVPHFGRKLLFLISLGIMNLCYGTSFFLHFVPTPSKALEAAITTLTLIADGTSKSAYIISIDQITIESYPTVVRCVAIGCITAVSHAGGLVMTLWASAHPGHTTHRLAMYGTAVALGVITWVLFLLFQEETKGQKLKETLQESGVPAATAKRKSQHHLSISTIPMIKVTEPHLIDTRL